MNYPLRRKRPKVNAYDPSDASEEKRRRELTPTKSREGSLSKNFSSHEKEESLSSTNYRRLISSIREVAPYPPLLLEEATL